MVSESVTSNHRVWASWQNHNNGPRTETFLDVLQSLRHSYPNHHVTLANEESELIKYADAGEAKALLDHEDDKFAAVRKYEIGERRSGIEAGKIIDEVRFGRYQYSWKGHQFLVYHAFYVVDQFFNRSEQWFFILYERHLIGANEARPKIVDDLISSATKWNNDLHTEIYLYDREQWTKSKKLWQSVQGTVWDDVILDPKVKAELINDVEGFFDNEDEYREYAVAYKRGIILHGPPGNGKSMTLKALMYSLSQREDPVPTLYVKSFHGCHQEWYNIREVFEKARATSPCLLVFEDLDSMVTEKVRSFFLNEVDGLEDNDGIMIVGSTNYLSRLDPSITKRPSRFDRKYHFALPSQPERIRYAEYWRAKLAENSKIDYTDGITEAFADATEGFSFAYLKEVFITSLLAIVGARRLGKEEPEGLEDDEGETNGHANGHANNDFNKDATPVLEEALLWRVLRKQIKVLRVQMEEAEKAEEESAAKEKEKKDKAKADGGEEEDESQCNGFC